MTLLQPLALAALVVVPLIYLIHLLHGSRRRVRVPAIFLWADLPRAQMARTRRRWPPLTALLLLQVLAAALAALALARLATPSTPPRHVALIVDASASMQATDIGPSRFEAARARALDRLASLSPGDRVSLIRAGAEASLVASGSPAEVRSALRGLQPGLARSAISDALALASSQVQATPDRQGSIVLVTDGAWPPPQAVGTLAAPVEMVSVGGGSDNQAISSLQVRLDPTGRGQVAFIEVANFSERAVRVPMQVSGDGAPLDRRDVDVAAHGRTDLSLPLPLDVHTIGAQLVGHDALALDNSVTVLAPGGPPRDVVLLGRGSAGLRRALESIPFVRLQTLTDLSGPLPHANLVVLEATLPAQLPSGPLLLVDPPSSSGRLLGVGLGSGARVEQGHPLLQGLDLATFGGQPPNTSGVPGWARVVFGTTAGPLIMEGQLEGHPTVALTFDPATSGLDKSLAFPLLVSNSTSFLLAEVEAGRNGVADQFDPLESEITPRPLPAFSSISTAAPTASMPADRWLWLVAASLGVLAAEWLVFARRG